MTPEYLDKWFPLERQRHYVSMLVKRSGLTRRRAEYFVRLWAYLLLKQHQELGKRLQEPLTKLDMLQGSVSCTHREASELFYSNKERGSDRAAGMMIDRLAAIGLLEKEFDGESTRIQIRPLPELTISPISEEPARIQLDDFNPQTDAVPLANLMARYYSQSKETSAAPHKLVRVLRGWAKQYPIGMRVLRRSDNHNPVGIYILYPTARESEENFFLPPGKSLFFGSDSQVDPFQMATPKDEECTCVFIRAWLIDNPYIETSTVCLFAEDVQKRLLQMQADFPNLCDLYTISLNPAYEEMRRAIGFQKTCQDNQRSIHWVYLPVDRLLALDMKQTLMGIKFQPLASV
ncbi:MAG TPA: hypothetical protein V6D28_24295 [Leptolyngbyaceae cyanobacterium]